jgi:hypothetical protein
MQILHHLETARAKNKNYRRLFYAKSYRLNRHTVTGILTKAALIADKLGDDFVYYIKGKEEGFATIREKIATAKSIWIPFKSVQILHQLTPH